MYDILKNAIYNAQKAQRNYDHTKVIPNNDLKLLIYAATNSPSKQNETHYRVHVITDENIIEEIYFHTKNFSLFTKDDIKEQFSDEGGVWKFDRDKCVRNSQVKANVLFVYEDYTGQARGGDHILAKNNKESVTVPTYIRSKDTSIGISVGELILTASILGYRSGISSGFDGKAVKKVLQSENPIKLLVGVGYNNEEVNRRQHPDVLNKDVGEYFRTGKPDENWHFPSFYKSVPVILNRKEYISESTSLINENRQGIIKHSIQMIKDNFPNRTNDYEKCIRDIQFVIDSYIDDLINKKTSSITDTASKYWKDGTRQLKQFDAELQVHEFIVSYICDNIIKDSDDKDYLIKLKNILIDVIENGSSNGNNI